MSARVQAAAAIAALVLILLAAFFLQPAAQPPLRASGEGEVAFEASAERFADAAACRAHLAGFVAASRDHVSAKGPYEVAPGDVRAHRVRVVAAGHEIEEQRCLGSALSSRKWSHGAGGEVAPFTIDDIEKMRF